MFLKNLHDVCRSTKAINFGAFSQLLGKRIVYLTDSKNPNMWIVVNCQDPIKGS